MSLLCSVCGEEYSTDNPIWRCSCGSTLDVKFSSKFPIDKIMTRLPNMWRYREAIPVSHPVSYCEGFTPIVREKISGKKVHLKLEYLFPSGSYKDRGASVLISKAKELGFNHVVEDSSGNAGAAIAAYSAKAGITCDIFVPEGTSLGKLTQISAYGANLHVVKGSREATTKTAMNAARQNYYASHIWNPYFLQGTKTLSYEITEQLGWKAPDTIICPVGHGTLLLGAYLGFKELKEASIIDHIPRIIGIQTENCPPLAKAWKKGNKTYTKITKKQTIAEGISIAEPVRAPQIIEAVKRTDGDIFTVSEDQILCALKVALKKGYYIEPTSATALAGLNTTDDLGETVIPLTGTGLKATEKIGSILS